MSDEVHAIQAPEGGDLPQLPGPVAQIGMDLAPALVPGAPLLPWTAPLFHAAQMREYARAALAAQPRPAPCSACRRNHRPGEDVHSAPAEGAGLVRPKLDASWIAAEDEAGGVFAAGALVEPSPELAYSTDEESYSLDFCSMLDSLRCDYDDAELVGKPYWVGDKHQHPASHFFNGSAERLIEHAQSFAWDNFGEYTDDFLDDVKPEAVAELQALIEAWADKHVNVNFWTVVNVRKLAVTEEDLT